MGVFSEINRLVKQAQLIMPPVYKPEVYRKGADNIVKAVKKVPNAAWGVIGTGAGLAKSIADRKWTVPISPMTPMSPVITVGKERPEGSWGDYVRAGWDAGYNHGDMAAAGMIEGAANSIPFAKFEAPSRFADFVQNEKIENGMDPEVSGTMRNRGALAGSITASLPVWSVAGKVLNIAGKAVAPYVKANPALVGRIAENFGPVPVIAGENILENHKTSRRIDRKMQLLRELGGVPHDDSAIGTARSGTDRTNADLQAMRDYAEAYGPYTEEERERRLEAYLGELRKRQRGS